MSCWMQGLIALALCATAPIASADDLATKGREILKSYGPAVVSLRIVMKEGYSSASGSHQEESKSEIVGTVVGADGLTVASLSSVDPGDTYNHGSSGDSDSGDEFSVQYHSELSDLKIVAPDGGEIPARVVLRDKELDLAFLAPAEKQAKPFPCVDLSKEASLDILDQVIVLNRLGRSADRVLHATPCRVEAIIQKPRTYYVLDRGSLGAPAFTPEGGLLGIVLSFPSTSEEEDSVLDYSMSEGLILKTAEIREAVAQARQGMETEQKPATK